MTSVSKGGHDRIRQAIERGSGQAAPVVVDLERSPITWDEAIDAAEAEFQRYADLREVWVIRGSRRYRIGGD